MCNVLLKCVQATLKNHKLHNDVKDLPRLGRPLKLTSRDQSYLYGKVRQDPKISYRELAEGSQIHLVTLVLVDGLYEDA